MAAQAPKTRARVAKSPLLEPINLIHYQFLHANQITALSKWNPQLNLYFIKILEAHSKDNCHHTIYLNKMFPEKNLRHLSFLPLIGSLWRNHPLQKFSRSVNFLILHRTANFQNVLAIECVSRFRQN